MNIHDIHSRRPVAIDPAGDPTDGPAPSETLGDRALNGTLPRLTFCS